MGMTIKALADNLKVSKTTIAKIIKKLNIEPERIELNKQKVIFLSDDEAERIASEYLSRHTDNQKAANVAQDCANKNGNGVNSADDAANGANGNKNAENTSGNTASDTAGSSQKDTASGTNSNTDGANGGANGSTIDTLLKQLIQKDRQIQDLTQALIQEQQLHARTQMQLLELKKEKEPEGAHPDQDRNEPTEHKEDKKGFWQKLFNG